MLDIPVKEDDTFFSYMPNCKPGLLNKIYTILLNIRNKEEGIDAKLKETLLQSRPLTPQEQINSSETLWFESIYIYSISLDSQSALV